MKPDGTVHSYNELRGAMPIIDDGDADASGVYIDFTASFMVLLNNPVDGDPISVQFPATDALDSEILDKPRQWIIEIMGACGQVPD